MKKFLVCILCVLMISAIPFAVFAEDIQTGNESTATETSAEGAISAPTEAPSEYTEIEEPEKTLSEKFEDWILPHFEEISVIITLIFTAFYNKRKHKLLNKSMGTMNNNAVSIAQNSSEMMSQALLNMQNASGAVTAYDTRIAQMLEAYKATAANNERLEHELSEMKAYLKTAAESNIEFANELAELLGLANIPNYKKEEIGARHLAAVKSIKAAESEALAQEADHVGEKA